MIAVIGIIVLACYIISKLTCGIARGSRCLVGKTAIVTGGNSGIGYEVCLNLASRGCRVIIADKTDSTETKKKIIQITGNPNIISKIIDLSKFKSVRNFADDINSTEERLDILINNAGIGGSSIPETEDGFNSVMQVNYLGPFLLTHLLLGLLKKSVPSRIIFTSSALAFCGNLKSATIKDGGICSGTRQAARFYANSKLATIMASDIFAEKLKGTGVTSNSLHPGAISTNIYNTVKNSSIVYALIRLTLHLFGKTVRDGAQTTIHLAVSDEVESVTGKYFADCTPFVKPLQARDDKLRQKIWKISEECVKLSPEEKL